jgi:DNA-binding transcriptional MerR regulator
MGTNDKIIYTIGDAARIAEVKPYVLRYWETEFDALRPEKSVTGQRCYRAKDLRLVLTLKQLLHREGFTIAGARKRLSEMSEEEWASFPPSDEKSDTQALPPGRSLEGTSDAPEPTVTHVLEVPLVSVVEETEPVRQGVDPATFEEFNRLWADSNRILNKYPH